MMKVVLGLGNPGVEYAGTRHNAGMMLVEKMSEKFGSDYGWRKHYGAMVFKSPEMVLVKSREVFMNESGRLLQGLPKGELYVAHDDLDIRLGEYKVQKGVGPKVHYGVQAVEGAVGSKDFWRIRIGVDNRPEGSGVRDAGEEYVLQRFTTGEREVVEKVLEEVSDEIFKADH